MELTTGTRLGSYEITGSLGAGGMGEVYRARDTALGRDVAVKVLPESLARDPDRLVRFDREARLLASISHPNIAHVYGVEPCGLSRAIVMELVPGPTLADRLAQGPMSLDEALTVGRQVAAALAAAHDQGIVHRDVKPSNIKAGETGVVKVLDFGLAKALTEDPLAAAEASTVVSPAMTARGLILGTAAYMSPEQARGKSIDKRTDVWAFGCVLYEMLTGARAFPGEDVQDTAVSVLSRDPDWSRLPAIPGAVRTLLRRCLMKDRTRRLADLHDAVLDIDDQLGGAVGVTETPVPSRRRTPWILWTVATAALVVALGLTVDRWRTPPQAEWRLDVVTPRTAEPAMFTLSPDGRRIVFVAFSGLVQQLWLRDLRGAGAVAAPLAGTEGARYPFWSPDGTALGFFAGRKLKRIDLNGGVKELADAPNARGGSWSEYAGGTIVFARGGADGIWRIGSNGGSASRVTTLEKGQIEHRHPTFLEDGRRFFFAAQRPGQQDLAPGGLFVADLAGGSPIRISDGFSQVVPLPADRIMFRRDVALVVQSLDARDSRLTGDPTIVESVVHQGLLSQGAFSWRPGVLAYRRPFKVRMQTQWFDRAGSPMSEQGTLGSGLASVDISADGSRAVILRDGEIFTVDLQTGRETRQARGGRPIWSSDGRAVFFGRQPGGIFRKTVDTDEAETVVLKHSTAWPADVSSDGRTLIFVAVTDETSHDLWSIALDGPAEPRPIARSSAREFQAQLSPNDQWIAYTSDETGQAEIYVQGLDENSDHIRVTTAGGVMPRWRQHGRELELLYLSLDARLTAVPVIMNGGRISFGTPKDLFHAPVILSLFQGSGVSPMYDVTSDGRFLISTDRSDQEPITVVLNWQIPARR